MIKVSVMYPNTEGATFDIDYYCKKHMGMVRELLGDALKGISVDKGLPGPQGPSPYIAMGHLMFDSVPAFLAAAAPHMGTFMADIPNYTNTRAVIQVSEIAL